MTTRRGFALGLAMASLPLMAGKKAADPVDGELQAERKAQVGLPRAIDPLWDKMRKCKVGYNNKSGLYSLTPTPEVSALVGTTVRVKGFTLPIDGSDMTQHFLIGVNTPVCFYHPPGEPNEVIEVFSVKPIAWTDKPITVEGTFRKINNGELGVFFRMDNAKPIKV